jgi:hypothetical protein
MGLSGLKKLEVRFLIAGEEGIFCRVSIARSDNEGRDPRGVSFNPGSFNSPKPAS